MKLAGPADIAPAPELKSGIGPIGSGLLRNGVDAFLMDAFLTANDDDEVVLLVTGA